MVSHYVAGVEETTCGYPEDLCTIILGVWHISKYYLHECMKEKWVAVTLLYYLIIMIIIISNISCVATLGFLDYWGLHAFQC